MFQKFKRGQLLAPPTASLMRILLVHLRFNWQHATTIAKSTSPPSIANLQVKFPTKHKTFKQFIKMLQVVKTI